jgi:putative ATPase
VGDDLFAAAAEEQLAQQAPLAARLRPQRLDDIVGQDELVGPGRPLRVLVESDRLSSAIFWGPPGTGKTTLAQVIARHTAKAYEQLSAVSASVKDVREVVARAGQRLGSGARGRSCSSTRSTGSTRPSRTRCSPRSRAGCSCWSGPRPRTRTSRSTPRS